MKQKAIYLRFLVMWQFANTTEFKCQSKALHAATQPVAIRYDSTWQVVARAVLKQTNLKCKEYRQKCGLNTVQYSTCLCCEIELNGFSCADVTADSSTILTCLLSSLLASYNYVGK